MSIKVSPTFALNRFNPKEVSKKYLRSDVIEDKPKSRFIIAGKAGLVSTQGDKEQESSSFTVKDRVNNMIVITTSNKTHVEYFTKTGGKIKKGGHCIHCRQEFKGYPTPLSFHEEVSGVDITREEYNNVFDRADDGEDGDDDELIKANIHTFWYEDTACCLECVYGYYKSLLNLGVQGDKINLSIRYLLKLFELLYPNGGTLVPAPDWRLLDANGGPLTPDEFYRTKHVYKRNPRVCLIPFRADYWRNQCNLSPSNG